MTLLTVVQARMGSARLPGKVLADLGGMPMLAFQLERIRDRIPPSTLIVATSNQTADNAIVDLCEAISVPVVRGPEDDVLARFALALDTHPADTLVRLTGDCPLSDPKIITAALDLHSRTGADYTSNVLPRSYPKGLDVEVVQAEALRAADGEAFHRADREHVTPFVYRHPERFRLANLESGHDLGDEWWTVDTAQDLNDVRAIVAQLSDPIGASWEEILGAVGRRQQVIAGQPRFRPGGSCAPGSSPWVRRWSVELDDRQVGWVVVSVASERVELTIEVPPALQARTSRAFEEFLRGDQQAREVV